MMKIIVIKRFSIRDKQTNKLKFYEVNETTAVEIEKELGQNAIAMGYAKLALSNKVESK